MTRGFISKPDLVSTTLTYPMTLTCDDSSAYGLSITINQFASIIQQAFEIQDSAGTIMLAVPPAGAVRQIGADFRSHHSVGGSYMALNGTVTPPCLEFPDGSSQGLKLWSGTGAPVAGVTVGSSPTAGDKYERRLAAAPTLVAMNASTAGSTVTSLAVGAGSSFLAGNAAAGDLMIVAAMNTVSAETCTIGADTGITDTGTDGGCLYTDGTRRIHMFSHVVQSGDISANTVTASAFTNSTGGGRRLVAMLFRSELGFATTGSKHGCPLIGSDNHSNASTTTSVTLTVSGVARQSVSVAAAYASGSSTVVPFLWDGGSTNNENDDVPGSGTSTGAHVSARPGLGTNTSGATGYATGGSSVVVAVPSAATGTLLGNWATNSSPATVPWLYHYNGSTWVVCG